MSTFWDSIELQQAAELLTAGDPPLIVQLLFANTVFVILWIAARTVWRNRIRSATLRFMQISFFMINLGLLMVPGNDLYELVRLV